MKLKVINNKKNPVQTTYYRAVGIFHVSVVRDVSLRNRLSCDLHRFLLPQRYYMPRFRCRPDVNALGDKYSLAKRFDGRAKNIFFFVSLRTYSRKKRTHKQTGTDDVRCQNLVNTFRPSGNVQRSRSERSR